MEKVIENLVYGMWQKDPKSWREVRNGYDNSRSGFEWIEGEIWIHVSHGWIVCSGMNGIGRTRVRSDLFDRMSKDVDKSKDGDLEKLRVWLEEYPEVKG